MREFPSSACQETEEQEVRATVDGKGTETVLFLASALVSLHYDMSVWQIWACLCGSEQCSVVSSCVQQNKTETNVVERRPSFNLIFCK